MLIHCPRDTHAATGAVILCSVIPATMRYRSPGGEYNGIHLKYTCASRGDCFSGV